MAPSKPYSADQVRGLVSDYGAFSAASTTGIGVRA